MSPPVPVTPSAPGGAAPRRRRWLVIAAVALAATGAAVMRAQPGPAFADARRAFEAPPHDARVMMRWWWFGPAVTESQIAGDLEAMKVGGLGGAEIQPVYPLALDTPGGVTNLPFLSAPFLRMLSFAGQRASALGLRLDLTLGSGWPFGGAGVGVLDAASRLRRERIVVPPGTPRVPRPAMTAGERWIGAFVGPDGDTPLTASAMAPLPWPDGQDAVVLPPARQARQVWMFVASRTGMQVKRPAIGAEGYVLSHYDRGALDRYLDRVGAPLLDAFGQQRPFAIFCDSLEVYESDWSPDFLEEFQRRRGYDIAPLLPVLAADRGEREAMAREDWGTTLTELLDERFITPLAAWARQRGTKLRMQGYGIPPATVSSSAAVDLPEGEGHHWRELTATRWASSASHLFARPVASSETWTWLHSPSFRATPLDVKAEADRHFLQGITQLVGHGWPSTPDGEPYPGWRFYAAGVFNDRNPWWIAMPDVARYLQRVSAVLRLGRPGNDVALYLPVHDGYAHAAPGRMHLLDLVRERLDKQVIGSILDAGLGFDLVDDAALAGHGTVADRQLTIGASRFRIVVVPAVHAMPAETLTVLERFADAGGVVIATGGPPVRPPGRQQADSRAAFEARVQALFARPDGRAVVIPDSGWALRRELARHVAPPISIADEQAREADGTRAVASEVGVIERRLEGTSVFFVVNTSNVTRRLRVRLPPRGLAEQWDAVRGVTSRAIPDARGDLAMVLAPYESRFLVQRMDVPADSAMSDGARPAADTAGTATSRAPGPFAEPAGDAQVVGPWTVRVDGETWTSEGSAMRGWHVHPSRRHFSGVAVYEAMVRVPAGPGRRWLDFGTGAPVAPHPRRNGFRAWLDAPVRDAAVVWINGTRVGSLWTPPYRLEVSGALRPGDNTIRVEVGNTAMNHMAGQSQPDYRLLHLRYGERFVPQDMDQVQVLPSGLLAPVRLVAEP